MNSLIIKFIIFCITTTVIGCSVNSKPKIQKYGLLLEKNEKAKVKINLKTYNSFNDLIERVEQIACLDSIPTIVLKSENLEIQIGLANPCWENFACILLKERNKLSIQDEKIHVNDIIHLDSLGKYMSKHYNNYGKSPLFSDSAEEARISISYQDLPIMGLSALLLKIVTVYEERNIAAPLIISFDIIIPPPPPPPN